MPQPDVRATAPFLAHLIATGQAAPQTCKRRRADPDLAVAAYAAIMQNRGTGRTCDFADEVGHPRAADPPRYAREESP